MLRALRGAAIISECAVHSARRIPHSSVHPSFRPTIQPENLPLGLVTFPRHRELDALGLSRPRL
jgi:hypothetical protein